MTRRGWKWLLAAGVITPLLIWGYDRSQVIRWVGASDLEIQFVVTDAGTGNPIPDARIEVHAEVNPLPDGPPQDFVLVTDADGVARQRLPRNTCAGAQSALMFTDTFSVLLPAWLYRSTAEGYDPTEWTWLNESERARQVQRVGRGKTRLVVPVVLPKRQP